MQYATYKYDVSGGEAKCNPHDWHKIDSFKSVQLLCKPSTTYNYIHMNLLTSMYILGL